MQFMVIGMFGRYADAEAAVLDIESAGIVGEQVENDQRYRRRRAAIS